MNVQKVMNLARLYGSATLINAEDGRQWLMTGGGFYPLDGMPELNEETLPVAAGIPMDKRDCFASRMMDMPETIGELLKDRTDGEPAKYTGITVETADGPFLLLQGRESGVTVLVDKRLTGPLEKKERELYMLWSRTGEHCVAAREGYMLRALLAEKTLPIRDTEAAEALEEAARKALAAARD